MTTRPAVLRPEPLGPSCSFMSFDLIFAVFSEDLFTGFTGVLLFFPFVWCQKLCLEVWVGNAHSVAWCGFCTCHRELPEGRLSPSGQWGESQWLPSIAGMHQNIPSRGGAGRRFSSAQRRAHPLSLRSKTKDRSPRKASRISTNEHGLFQGNFLSGCVT